MASKSLITQAPRETSGPEAFRAFDFQVHASMARILDKIREGEAFVAYFDHFDDLIFLQEQDGKTEISFYQMKASREKPWTPKRLAQRSTKGLSPKSIIGKAYHNLHEFGALVRKAAIISNQHLKAEFPDGSKTTADSGEILLSKLSKAEHDVLVAAIDADFPGGSDPRHADVLTYERIPLDLQSFRQTLLGAITEFAHAIGPEYVVTAKPLYDALLSEITRCTGTVSHAKTLVELKKQKGLSQTDVDALVSRVQQRSKTPGEWLPTVQPELAAAGWKALALHRLSLDCWEYWRARASGASVAVNLSGQLRDLLVEHTSLIGDSAHDSLEALELASTIEETKGEPYGLKAALLVEMMESLG